MSAFAISDIHGCIKSFERLLALIGFSKSDELYLLGDYIDRGPDSKGVIDKIWALQEEGYDLRCIRGNHEQMMMEAHFTDDTMALWFRNGGAATLQSFGADKLDDVPDQYIDWMKNLPFYLMADDKILIHAGLSFVKENPLEERYDMLWKRRWYDNIDRSWLGERIIIHGHTATPRDGIESALASLAQVPALVIDAGCVFTKHEGLGYLCAFDMTNRQLYFQQNVEAG